MGEASQVYLGVAIPDGAVARKTVFAGYKLAGRRRGADGGEMEMELDGGERDYSRRVSSGTDY